MKKLFAMAVLCGFCGVLFAQQTRDKPASGQPVSSDLTVIQTANNLAKYGYNNYSASALITAAEILTKVQTQPLNPSAITGGGQGGTTGKTEKPEFTPANLIADAKRYAAGDSTLLSYAAKVEAEIGQQTRGALGGPREQWDKVSANSALTYQLAFTAGRLAEIVVSGDGDTDLDLYVYDANGNLIEFDENYSDDCYVSWVPRWTGAYTIQIVNRGRVYNQFVIATN
jgi:hypothetical protein